jgi:prepilin-type N-terminal cleavage/methylation domain-containing protein
MTASHPAKTGSNRQGFSLVELLVVIAIIGLLVSLLIPSLSQARARSEEIKDVANIRAGSYHFLTYFNDHKGFFPPLAGTWGYNYGSWYTAMRPYVTLGNKESSNFNYRQDNPMALLCESRVSGQQAAGFPRSLYATNWVLRYRVFGDPTTSYRVDELQNVSRVGLLMCNGWVGDSIYWMTIPAYTAAQYTSASAQSVYYSGQHRGLGGSVSYLDGRAEFVRFGRQTYNDYSMSTASSDQWTPDIPWTHRSFWGRTRANVWLQGQYKYND